MIKKIFSRLACSHYSWEEKPSDMPFKFYMFQCVCCKKKVYTMKFEDRPVSYSSYDESDWL